MSKLKISAIDREKAAILAAGSIIAFIDMIPGAPPSIHQAMRELAAKVGELGHGRNVPEVDMLAFGMPMQSTGQPQPELSQAEKDAAKQAVDQAMQRLGGRHYDA